MNLMMCMRGEPEQLPFLPEISRLGAGIELGSYGLIGIQSERDWETRFQLHQATRAQFQGPIAIHGPFIGMEYAHVDHLIRGAVKRRLDMTYDAAVKLGAGRVILHSGCTPETEIFNLQDSWLKRNIDFWLREIDRWAGAGIEIVLENATEKSPDLLVWLANEIDNPFLGLCMDIGHQHLFSELDALEWACRMGNQLYHIHLHDNDRTGDRHWPLGRGSIDFEPFLEAVVKQVPQATLALEVEAEMEVKMGNLRRLAAYFTSLS